MFNIGERVIVVEESVCCGERGVITTVVMDEGNRGYVVRLDGSEPHSSLFFTESEVMLEEEYDVSSR